MPLPSSLFTPPLPFLPACLPRLQPARAFCSTCFGFLFFVLFISCLSPRSQGWSLGVRFPPFPFSPCGPDGRPNATESRGSSKLRFEESTTLLDDQPHPPPRLLLAGLFYTFAPNHGNTGPSLEPYNKRDSAGREGGGGGRKISGWVASRSLFTPDRTNQAATDCLPQPEKYFPDNNPGPVKGFVPSSFFLFLFLFLFLLFSFIFIPFSAGLGLEKLSRVIRGRGKERDRREGGRTRGDPEDGHRRR